MSRGRSVLVAVFGWLLIVAAPVAASDPDPLGILPGRGVAEQLSLGADPVSVFICESPRAAQHEESFTLQEVVDFANDEVVPFYDLISRGRYDVEFVAGSTFTLEGGVDYDHPAYVQQCIAGANQRSTTSNTMVIDRAHRGSGLGSSGRFSLDAEQMVVIDGLGVPSSTTERGFWVGGRAFERPQWIAHELGHTLAWPHSGSADDESLAEYDNQLDLMSGSGASSGNPSVWGNFCDGLGPCEITHTLAINRYASGWIDADEVLLVLADGHEAVLQGPEHDGGLAMALVPTADPNVFLTVEARPNAGYDAVLPVAGAVVHEVDLDRVCDLGGVAFPVCWGQLRRQQPAVAAINTADHVVGVGEQLTVHGVTISVTAATSDGFAVSFSGRPQGCGMGPDHFVDVSASSFAYESIACIRLLGITTGTSPTTYAPTESVTREQMAAFLGRMVRVLDTPCDDSPIPFDDVAATSFAFGDIGCIFHLGITQGTTATTYAPARLVTREEMAAFLARTWVALGNVCPTGPTPLTDVPASSFAFDAVACIYHLGITTGTGPTTYSPADQVTREQMAAFLERLWTNATSS